MKVQLVFAPPFAQSSTEVLGEFIWPPLGILYLAAYLREKMQDIEINVVDGCVTGYENVKQQICQFTPDILAISFYTMTAYGATKLAEEIRNIHPETLIVLGGPHATALPEEILRSGGGDLVVVGEGEETFYQIVKRFREAGKQANYQDIPGVCCLNIQNGISKFISTKPQQFITPLDSIPYPARDLLDLSVYRGWFLTKKTPETIIISSRGCPFHCTFCSNMVWKSSTPQVRFRSAKNIVDEMEYLHRKFGICEIFDNADEFNCSVDQALEVCREIKRRNLRMAWKAQLRAKPFTEELAREMAEAGCWYVHVGVESGNNETLKGINKHITLDDVVVTCKLLQKYHIKVWALFMLFNVWEENGILKFEGRKESEQSLKFAWYLINNRLANYISWSVTTPYPGSQLYNIALRHNLIKPKLLDRWENWQSKEIFVIDLPGISKKDQVIVKWKGELLRVRCFLINMDFKVKDIPFLIKRGWHLLTRMIAKN